MVGFMKVKCIPGQKSTTERPNSAVCRSGVNVLYEHSNGTYNSCHSLGLESYHVFEQAISAGKHVPSELGRGVACDRCTDPPSIVSATAFWTR